jgi:hypothetical protein
MKNLWFIATIITKCEIAGKPSNTGEWTCSEQIFVLRAPNRDTAYQYALEIGKSQETSYRNIEGQDVSWVFVGLENLEELPNNVIRDRTEITGCIFHTADPDALVVEQEGLSVYYQEEIKNIFVDELLKDNPETKLIYNRIRYLE